MKNHHSLFQNRLIKLYLPGVRGLSAVPMLKFRRTTCSNSGGGHAHIPADFGACPQPDKGYNKNHLRSSRATCARAAPVHSDAKSKNLEYHRRETAQNVPRQRKRRRETHSRPPGAGANDRSVDEREPDPLQVRRSSLESPEPPERSPRVSRVFVWNNSFSVTAPFHRKTGWPARGSRHSTDTMPECGNDIAGRELGVRMPSTRITAELPAADNGVKFPISRPRR